MTELTTSRSPEASDGSAAVELDSISKSFGGLEVLRDVTFSVPQASVFGVAGPNGAGKTTLLNLMTGFGSFGGGRMRFHGVDATGRSAREISALGVARTFQNIRLFRGLTAQEQVEAGTYQHREASLFSSMLGLPVDRRDRATSREAAMDALETVGLADRADRLAETLSYGDQRRIEVARALATRPSVLLLDEPTAGMNDADWKPIADLLDRLRDDGMTVIVIEHNMRLLELACDRVAVIDAGQVIAEDEPTTCLRTDAVRRAYFGE